MMSEKFSKTEGKSEMTEAEVSQYQTYRFSNNVSMKEIGSTIEGLYKGIEVKPGQGIKGTHLYIVHLEKDGKDITFVGGWEVLAFLENFTTGYYLHVTRTNTLETKEGNKYAQYEFSYDPLGIKLKEKFKLYDMSEMPVSLQPIDKKKTKKTEQEV